jgi:hypothetical protein
MYKPHIPSDINALTPAWPFLGAFVATLLRESIYGTIRCASLNMHCMIITCLVFSFLCRLGAYEPFKELIVGGDASR